MVEFGCVGAEIKWDTVWFCGLWFVVCGLWFPRKIRPTQLWVELSWVVAIWENTLTYIDYHSIYEDEGELTVELTAGLTVELKVELNAELKAGQKIKFKLLDLQMSITVITNKKIQYLLHILSNYLD